MLYNSTHNCEHWQLNNKLNLLKRLTRLNWELRSTKSKTD